MKLSKRSELACVLQLQQLQASAMLQPQVRTELQCEDAATTAAIQRGLDLAATIQASEAKPADDSASKLPRSRGAVTVTKDGARVACSCCSCSTQASSERLLSFTACSKDNTSDGSVLPGSLRLGDTHPLQVVQCHPLSPSLDVVTTDACLKLATQSSITSLACSEYATA